MVKVLREMGYYEILEAECYEKAVKAIRMHKPDLIFSDWVMPDGTGLDLLKQVRSDPSTQELPFIMVTTQKDQQKIIEASKAGLQSYMLKPVKKEIVAEKLRNLSSAYGFPPPLGYAEETTTPSAEQNDPAQEHLKGLLQGTINEQCITKIIERTLKGIDDDFPGWIAQEVFGAAGQERSDDVKVLVEALKISATEALTVYLEQFI